MRRADVRLGMVVEYIGGEEKAIIGCVDCLEGKRNLTIENCVCIRFLENPRAGQLGECDKKQKLKLLTAFVTHIEKVKQKERP